MLQKYIHFSRIGFILWPDTDSLAHADVALAAASDGVVSAGFVEFSRSKSPHCFGRSDSLGIASKPTDSEDLAAQLYGE